MITNSNFSTKSGSNTRNKLSRKEFVFSGDFYSGKSDGSLDLNQSCNQDSLTIKDHGCKEKNLIAGIEALDASIIPVDSKSFSLLKEYTEGDEDQPKQELKAKPKPLVLENSQIHDKILCFNCVLSDKKGNSACYIL